MIILIQYHNIATAIYMSNVIAIAENQIFTFAGSLGIHNGTIFDID